MMVRGQRQPQQRKQQHPGHQAHPADREQRIRDLSLLMYVATIGSQVVLTGKKGDAETIRRVEDLMARVALGQRDDG